MSRPVSIVIPSWNGRAILQRNLPSVRLTLHEFGPGGEAIVVDDGSDDGTAAWMAEAHPWARCLRREENGGFGAATHSGVAAARFDLVVLLNNDMRLEPDFLGPLLAPFGETDRLFATVPRILNRTHGGDEAVTACRFRFGLLETLFPERRGDPAAGAGARREILFACGGAAAFERRLWLDLGGFDPMYAPFYWEDVDLSWRARRRGWLILQAPASVARHEHAATIGARFSSRRVRAVYERNRLLFQWKCITSPRLTARHLLWLPLRLAASPLTGLDLLRGFLGALPRLPRALAGRTRLRSAARVSDDSIIARFLA